MEPQKPQWMIEQDLKWKEKEAEKKRLALQSDSFIDEVSGEDGSITHRSKRVGEQK